MAAGVSSTSGGAEQPEKQESVSTSSPGGRAPSRNVVIKLDSLPPSLVIVERVPR